MLTEALRVTIERANTLERLGIRYFVGGSLASSIHGFPRSTRDVDLVVDLDRQKASSLVSALEGSFYVSEDAVRDAVRLRDSFNVIHFETVLDVDMFVLKDDPFWHEEMRRGVRVPIEGVGELVIASAEDIVLAKLDWYRLGGGVSERQWDDVLGVLKVRGPALDRAYLARWSSVRGLDDLLARAYGDAGLGP